MKHLTNDELNAQLKVLVQQEREILSQILLHIQEVDRRRLYLKLAYSSLFSYLTECLGYSAGSAQRRIDAARLIRDVPQLPEKLESGNLNLSQISLVQKALRQKKISVPKEQKQELLQKLENQSLEKSQVLVAQALDIPIQNQPKVQHQKDRSVRLEITLTEEQWQKLQQAKEILSHSLPNGSLPELIELLADKVIQQKPKASNHIPAKTRQQLLSKGSCCEYQDPKTKQKCASKWQLQVDHIQPKWTGGSDEPENLRVLCAKHNRERYREQRGF